MVLGMGKTVEIHRGVNIQDGEVSCYDKSISNKKVVCK